MGHLVGKNLYRRLGRKIDNLTVRAPWNKTFYSILKELYTPDEAEVAIKFPYGICDFDQVLRATGYDSSKLQRIIDSLCVKGLVMDFWINGNYRYMLSPLIIGIFEFTMMRTGEGLNTREMAVLFYEYLHDNKQFYGRNFGKGMKVSPLRAIPHEDAIDDTGQVEILDYEKASAIIDDVNEFAVGICSCRHEKLHAGVKKCDTPLETCTTLGPATEYMNRHGFARPVSKSELLENLARYREMGLVISADNVRKDVSFFCFCCGCCCNVLLGVSRLGYPNALVTSSFIARNNCELCSECGTCAESCPIDAISISADGRPSVNAEFCLGCGVCAVKCPSGAMRLTKRSQRVLHPENTFQRVILQSLERGTLQNLLFTDIGRIDHKFMRVFVGAFLKLPPVKRGLMSENLRSSFLHFMEKGP